MKFFSPFLLVIMIIVFFTCCSTGKYIGFDELTSGNLKIGGVYKIRSECNLRGQMVLLPNNCVLEFMEGGSIRNGTITGQDVRIKYHKPFLGESISIQGCVIDGKRVIRDQDVFLTVGHTQEEIQLLFDISGGTKIVFSPGNYHNVEKIEIKNNVDADFSNSTIYLFYDINHVGECFYMEPWVNKGINFCKIRNLTIKGKSKGFSGKRKARRCIQLFHVSEVVLDRVIIDEYNGGPEEYKNDASDLLDKSRVGTSVIAIMKYDKCTINSCATYDINKEIFWCVPNNNPKNITYFTNNKSTCSFETGSASFFTILDGRCIVRNNEVYNYKGSAFNVFCYDSDISDNMFYNGKRSIAIDLSEGTMYRAKNVNIHNNYCYNTKGMVSAYGEGIKIYNNFWSNNLVQEGDRIYVCFIKNRGRRIKGGKYVGCENNLEDGLGSKDILIANNNCENTGAVRNKEINFACLYGDNISVLSNSLSGFNVPVVQLVEGADFTFESNILKESLNGNYAELLINRCDNIEIKNNRFNLVYSKQNTSCTIQLFNPEGYLIYRGNKLNDNSYDKERHTPCLIRDLSKLKKTEIQSDENR